MKINPYLNFAGNCKEAFEFYQSILGGELNMMTHGQSPMADQFPDWRDKINHVCLSTGEFALMGSDSPPQYFQQPQGFFVSLIHDDAAEGRRIFDALAEGGTIRMPFEKTFWAEGFGILVDKFGTPWMINCGM